MPKKKEGESANPNLLLNSKEREQGHSCHHLMSGTALIPGTAPKERQHHCVCDTHILCHTLNLHRNWETTLKINKQNPQTNQPTKKYPNQIQQHKQTTKNSPQKQNKTNPHEQTKKPSKVTLITLVNMENKSSMTPSSFPFLGKEHQEKDKLK